MRAVIDTNALLAKLTEGIVPPAELPKVLEAGFPNWRRDLVERLNDARSRD